MVAVGGWSGPGGHGVLSGPEASRGGSEGLATKEGWQQVGWGLMAVPCPVSGGLGAPRPPARRPLTSPASPTASVLAQAAPRHPDCPLLNPFFSPFLSCVPQNVASSVRLGLRWRMLMEERREPSNPGSGEKTNCKIKAQCLGPTRRVRGSLGAGERRAGATSWVGAQGHLLTLRPGSDGAATVGGNSSLHSPVPPGFQPLWLHFSFSNTSQLSAGKWGGLGWFVTEHLPGIPQEYVQEYTRPCGDLAERRQGSHVGPLPSSCLALSSPFSVGKDWTSLLPGAQQCVCTFACVCAWPHQPLLFIPRGAQPLDLLPGPHVDSALNLGLPIGMESSRTRTLRRLFCVPP